MTTANLSKRLQIFRHSTRLVPESRKEKDEKRKNKKRKGRSKLRSICPLPPTNCGPYIKAPSRIHTPPSVICCTWRTWTNLIKSRCHLNLKCHIIWEGSAKGFYVVGKHCAILYHDGTA